MDGVDEDSLVGQLLSIWDFVEERTIRSGSVSLLGVLLAPLLLLYRWWLDVLAIVSLTAWWGLGQTVNTLDHGWERWGPAALAAIGVALVTVLLWQLQSQSTVLKASPSALVQTSSGRKSRPANGLEKTLERAFHSYLEHLVKSSRKPVTVVYYPSGTDAPKSILRTRDGVQNDVREDEKATVTLKVLTPDFYTRFVHYAHDSEAIFSEMTDSRTVQVDHAELLPDIFLKKASPPLRASGLIDSLAFETLRRLRRLPRDLSPDTTKHNVPQTSRSDIRGFRISSMDAYIIQHADDALREDYRSAILKLFIADRLFGGSLVNMEITLLVVRTISWWLIASFLWADTMGDE